VTLEETRNAFKGLLSRPGSRRDLPRPPKQSHAAPPPETTAVKVSVRQRSTTLETVGGRPRLASTHHVQHRFATDLAYAAKIAYIHAKRCGRKTRGKNGKDEGSFGFAEAFSRRLDSAHRCV